MNFFFDESRKTLAHDDRAMYNDKFIFERPPYIYLR